MRTKFDLFRQRAKQCSEKLRSWLGTLREKGPGALRSLPSLPGASTTLRSGKFLDKLQLHLPAFAKKLNLSNINWENVYRKSFLYNSIASMICGYFVADFLVAALTPWFPAAEPPRPRIASFADRKDFRFYEAAILPQGRPNLFSEKGLVPNNDEGGGGFDGPPVRTSLPLTLLGVIVLDEEAKSVASIDDKGQNQVIAIRENEQLSHDVTVQKIEPTRVIFLNQATQRREFIELPQDQILATRRAAPVKPSGIQQASDNRYVIDRKEVDKAMENMNEILTQARCVPEFEGGKPAGYRCFQIVPGSIYEKLGLQDNDVICGIDGEPINDLAAAFTKLQGLKTAKGISICIKRNGQVSNKQYDIP